MIGPTFTSFKLPFGTVYALNLTPDIDTGTGTWTEEMVLGIFRKARHLGGDGRVVLPPMPWWTVASLSDEDIVSIFAYLRSIPPIVNAVPSSEIPPPVLEALAGVADGMLAQMAGGLAFWRARRPAGRLARWSAGLGGQLDGWLASRLA